MKIVRNAIKRNIPNKTSFSQFIKTKLNHKTHVLTKSKKDTFTSRNYNKKVDLNKTQTSTYKNLNHRVNYCKLNLNADIDPAKTIHAPYSEGNAEIFGQNAGWQCLPNSLCSLIYINRNHSIVDFNGLVNIMQMGELYIALSRLSRQTYLLLTELSPIVTVQDTNYSLEFSKSNTALSFAYYAK